MTYSALGRLDAAIGDYQSLLNVAKSNYRIAAQYNLGEIYFRKKNRKESLKYFQDFLKAAPPGTPEIPAARERVKLLESGGSI
jgi:tetratricopeptide (TPR) repeat protein